MQNQQERIELVHLYGKCNKNVSLAARTFNQQHVCVFISDFSKECTQYELTRPHKVQFTFERANCMKPSSHDETHDHQNQVSEFYPNHSMSYNKKYIVRRAPGTDITLAKIYPCKHNIR